MLYFCSSRAFAAIEDEVCDDFQDQDKVERRTECREVKKYHLVPRIEAHARLGNLIVIRDGFIRCVYTRNFGEIIRERKQRPSRLS